MENRHIILLRILAAALLAHFALSWPLWDDTCRTTFPLVPFAGIPFPKHPWWSTAQALVTVAFPLGCAIFPHKRFAWVAWFGWLLWMIAQDLNRLQPWMYFYLLALGLLLSGAAAARETTLRWLIAAVYAWGGFNKLTPYFAVDNFPWFCEAFRWTKPLGAYPAAGYAVAVAEGLLAAGLLWPRSRPFFRWITIGFHLFIALALSPIGLNWNTVVIPWNLAMAGMVWVLFSGKSNPGHTSILSQWSRNNWLPAAVLSLAWIFPALNIIHGWPEPLSWKMYANTQTEATFYSNAGVPCPALQPVWQQYAYDRGTKLLIDDWAFADLHVPAFNSPDTYRQIAQYLCACAAPADSCGLLLLTVERWDRSAEHWEQIPCAHLTR